MNKKLLSILKDYKSNTFSGSISLAIHEEHYFGYSETPIHDIDIVGNEPISSSIDGVHIDITRLGIVKNTLKDIKLPLSEVVDGWNVITLEAQSLSYINRALKGHPRYYKDIPKLSLCRKMLRLKGTYDSFKEAYYNSGRNEHHILFTNSEYINRVFEFNNTDTIICGQFALVVYYDYLLDKDYELTNYDLELANTSKDGNHFGSRIIPREDKPDFNIIDGYKLESLAELSKKYNCSELQKFDLK